MERFLKAAAILLVTIFMLIASSATPARADSDGAATVTASALNMRSEASTSGSIVTCLPRGTVVIVNGQSDGWAQVTYKDHQGYMSAEYLSFSSSADGELGSGTVTGSVVNIRSGPDTSYSVLARVEKGDCLTVTGVSDNWYKVEHGGSDGYIRSDYLALGSGGGTGSSAGSAAAESSPAVTAASGSGTINASGVRLRSGPSTSYSILDAFDAGTTMTVTGEAGDWYKVDHNGTEGYVYGKYLTVGESASNASAGYTVSDLSDTAATAISAVHFRTGPDTSYTSITVLSPGTSVTITGETENWYRVSYSGSEGFVYKTYLTTEDYSSPSYSASEGERIVSKAKEYMGTPYVYGGSTPSGFDCSGFVYYVFRQCGYSVTRTATTQNGDGVQVSRSELQPGDILIFYNSAKSGIGHSGIYIGGGEFIHASSSGGKVMISSLSSTYYDTHYYSARRVAG